MIWFLAREIFNFLFLIVLLIHMTIFIAEIAFSNRLVFIKTKFTLPDTFFFMTFIKLSDNLFVFDFICGIQFLITWHFFFIFGNFVINELNPIVDVVVLSLKIPGGVVVDMPISVQGRLYFPRYLRWFDFGKTLLKPLRLTIDFQFFLKRSFDFVLLELFSNSLLEVDLIILAVITVLTVNFVQFWCGLTSF